MQWIILDRRSLMVKHRPRKLWDAGSIPADGKNFSGVFVGELSEALRAYTFFIGTRTYLIHEVVSILVSLNTRIRRWIFFRFAVSFLD